MVRGRVWWSGAGQVSGAGLVAGAALTVSGVGAGLRGPAGGRLQQPRPAAARQVPPERRVEAAAWLRLLLRTPTPTGQHGPAPRLFRAQSTGHSRLMARRHPAPETTHPILD